MTATLIDYIQNTLLVGQSGLNLKADDDLLESGLVDSLSIMKMIVFIEKEFEVKIPPQDLIIDNFITVNAIKDYLDGIKS
jgi:acyl carrier protein